MSRSTITILFGCIFATALTVLTCGCEKAATSTSLKATVEAMWNDAGVGSDDDYVKLISEDLRKFASAPADMRLLCGKLSNNERLREWPTDLEFSCDRAQAVLRWTVRIPSTLEYDKSLDQFSDVMKAQGYRVVVDEDSAVLIPPSQLLPRVANNKSKFNRVHRRTIGDTVVVVVSQSLSNSGSPRLLSGLSLEWYVSRKYTGPKPTLREALSVLPDNFKADYLAEDFYREFSIERISHCFARRKMVGVTFVNAVEEGIVEHLESNGFHYKNEFEPRDNHTSKAWNRFADATYAYIDKTIGKPETGFRCQAPQLKGPPRTGEPLPVHPSLKLPMSKRPVLELTELTFANKMLQQDAVYFDGLAKSVAGEDWKIQKYKDKRYSNSPIYEAFWQTADVQGSHYPTRIRPFQAIHINLKGVDQERDDVISCVDVRGRWFPLTGWTAFVNYASVDAEYGGNDMCSARVGWIEHEHQTALFSASRTVVLSRPAISVTVTQDKLHFECRAHIPWDSTDEGKSAYRHRFLKMYESAETMRDLVIADLEAVRKIAVDKIRNGDLHGKDFSHVRSNLPPVYFDTARRAPTQETTDALIQKVNEWADGQVRTVREHHEAIYQAMTKALPLSPDELKR